MPFGLLVLHNLMTKKLRTVITAMAVALGIAMVVTLGVLTFSLRESAIAILETADADFTVAQEGVIGSLHPPTCGRAPGWHAGDLIARREATRPGPSTGEHSGVLRDAADALRATEHVRSR